MKEILLDKGVQYGPETVEATTGGTDEFMFFIPTLMKLNSVMRTGTTLLRAENEPDRDVSITGVITLGPEGMQLGGEFSQFTVAEPFELELGGEKYTCTYLTLTGKDARAELSLLANEGHLYYDTELAVGGDEALEVDTWYDLVYGHVGQQQSDYGDYAGLRVALESQQEYMTYEFEEFAYRLQCEMNREKKTGLDALEGGDGYTIEQPFGAPFAEVLQGLRVNRAIINTEGDKVYWTPYVRITLYEGYGHNNPDVPRAMQLLFVPSPQCKGDYLEVHSSGVYDVDGAGVGDLHILSVPDANGLLRDMVDHIRSSEA